MITIDNNNAEDVIIGHNNQNDGKISQILSNFETKIEERLSCIEDMLNIENNKKSHQRFNNNRRSKVNPNYNNYWKIDRDFHANKKAKQLYERQ